MFQVELFKVWNEGEGFLTLGIMSDVPRYDSLDYVIENYIGRELIIYKNKKDLDNAYRKAIEFLKEDYNKVLIGWEDAKKNKMVFA
ncbi:hypothetical protein ACQKMX_27670 [Bacillus cereus]|uniref:hypothetical protein n=1 Tax=Bacillus cereus TaxID=1396 RepID=UPI003CFD6C26